MIKSITSFAFYRKNHRLEKWIRKEIALKRKTGSFSSDFISNVSPLLSKTKNLITLHSELENAPDAAEWFRTVILSKIDVYLKKTEYEQAFYTYVISLFDYRDEPVPPNFANQFLSFLNSKSLYTFSNAMNAIYRFGQVRLLLLGIDKANEKGQFYHKKLLVDGILSSTVDQTALSTELVKRFHHYSPYIQECLLDVFRMGGANTSDLCIELITDSNTNEQVRFCAMRYFIKHPDPSSRALFMDILRNEEVVWVEQMLAIQALGHYHDDETYQAIKDKVTSQHWHVRIKAVAYLHDLGINREDIYEILQMQDKYASEALLYQYKDDHEMTLYIIHTIQSLANQHDQEAYTNKTEVNPGVV